MACKRLSLPYKVDHLKRLLPHLKVCCVIFFGQETRVVWDLCLILNGSHTLLNTVVLVHGIGTPFVRSVIPIACGVKHTAWQIAISEVQRQAIYADPMWDSDTPQLAHGGLSVARQMGMISYRTAQGYQAKFGRRMKTDTTATSAPLYGSEAQWQVKSYLEYQGKKFLDRFDPITYVKLTEQMDSHDVGRNRGGDVAQALSQVTIPARILGIDSDILYPLTEQEEMAHLLPRGELKVIHSEDGHDGFLLEQEQVAHYIQEFLETINKDESKSRQ